MISSKDFGILTYSIKYRDYLRSIRNGQIERAEKMIARGERSTGRKRPNDPKRLIATDHATQDGEVEKKLSATSIRSGLTKRKNMTVFMLSAQIWKMNRKRSSK